MEIIPNSDQLSIPQPQKPDLLMLVTKIFLILFILEIVALLLTPFLSVFALVLTLSGGYPLNIYFVVGLIEGIILLVLLILSVRRFTKLKYFRKKDYIFFIFFICVILLISLYQYGGTLLYGFRNGFAYVNASWEYLGFPLIIFPIIPLLLLVPQKNKFIN